MHTSNYIQHRRKYNGHARTRRDHTSAQNISRNNGLLFVSNGLNYPCTTTAEVKAVLVCSLFQITIYASLRDYFLTAETQKVFETYYSCYELTKLVTREDFITTFDQSRPVENNQIQQEETDCQNV